MPISSAIERPEKRDLRLVTMVRRKALIAKMFSNQRRDRPCGGKVRKVVSLSAAPTTMTSGPIRNR